MQFLHSKYQRDQISFLLEVIAIHVRRTGVWVPWLLSSLFQVLLFFHLRVILT